MIDSAVIVLPQPDSPTSPSVRRASMSKLTPSAARFAGRGWQLVRRSRIQQRHGIPLAQPR
jgi:hypothetical protein